MRDSPLFEPPASMNFCTSAARISTRAPTRTGGSSPASIRLRTVLGCTCRIFAASFRSRRGDSFALGTLGTLLTMR